MPSGAAPVLLWHCPHHNRGGGRLLLQACLPQARAFALYHQLRPSGGDGASAPALGAPVAMARFGADPGLRPMPHRGLPRLKALPQTDLPAPAAQGERPAFAPRSASTLRLSTFLPRRTADATLCTEHRKKRAKRRGTRLSLLLRHVSSQRSATADPVWQGPDRRIAVPIQQQPTKLAGALPVEVTP